jgi:esterase
MVFLHGILGSGSNWRSFARQLIEVKPAWGALLVDLRLHGDSRGFLPPHTIAAAAGDIVEWLRQSGEGPVQAVLGHSFGGKVAIELARQLSASPEGAVDDLFVIDSTPGPRPDRRGSSSVIEIIDLLEGVPSSFPDRGAFTSWVEARGVSRPVAMWLAMNVRPVPNTTIVELRLDIAQIRAMLDDYFARDLWPVLDELSKPSPRVTRTHIIAGGRSDVLDAADLSRGRSLAHGTVDVLEKAGHWVHVDAPKELLDAVLGHLDAR